MFGKITDDGWVAAVGGGGASLASQALLGRLLLALGYVFHRRWEHRRDTLVARNRTPCDDEFVW